MKRFALAILSLFACGFVARVAQAQEVHSFRMLPGSADAGHGHAGCAFAGPGS